MSAYTPNEISDFLKNNSKIKINEIINEYDEINLHLHDELKINDNLKIYQINQGYHKFYEIYCISCRDVIVRFS